MDLGGVWTQDIWKYPYILACSTNSTIWLGHVYLYLNHSNSLTNTALIFTTQVVAACFMPLKFFGYKFCPLVFFTMLVAAGMHNFHPHWQFRQLFPCLTSELRGGMIYPPPLAQQWPQNFPFWSSGSGWRWKGPGLLPRWSWHSPWWLRQGPGCAELVLKFKNTLKARLLGAKTPRIFIFILIICLPILWQIVWCMQL